MIGNCKQSNICFKINYTSGRFVQQCNNFQGNGVACFQQVHNVIQCSACIDDIFYDDYMVVADILIQIHCDFNSTCGNCTTVVTFCSHKTDFTRDCDRTAQVCHKYKSTFQDTYQQDRSAIVGITDFLTYSRNSFFDLILSHKDIFDLTVVFFHCFHLHAPLLF